MCLHEPRDGIPGKRSPPPRRYLTLGILVHRVARNAVAPTTSALPQRRRLPFRIAQRKTWHANGPWESTRIRLGEDAASPPLRVDVLIRTQFASDGLKRAGPGCPFGEGRALGALLAATT